MVRTKYVATVESGTVEDVARLDLGHGYMWLYPRPDGTVHVEFEDKAISEND